MFRSVILLFFFTILSAGAWASPGQIGEIKGSGVLERNNEVIEGTQGVGVESMDTAVTANGRMRIDFVDETRVDLTEHSRLLIDEFVYDPANDVGSLSIKTTLGGVRYASGQIAKRYKQNVKIKTPSATIGVRGTDFIMLVDEAGGTMVTLLPSCDVEGYCYTGEISVESDAGYVIMNQAFQSTMVTHGMKPPSPPLVLPIDESMINNLLILRKKTPYDEEEEELRKKAKQMFDFLGQDLLEFDELDEDALTKDIEAIWATEIEYGVEYYLADMLFDLLDMLNLALVELFKNLLDKQNEAAFVTVQTGYDDKTRITLTYEDPTYRVTRIDIGARHKIDMKLNDQYGYTINMEQQDEVVYEYTLGSGANNTIDVIQRQ